MFGNSANDTFGWPLYLGVGGGTNTGVIKLDSARASPWAAPIIKSAPWALSGRAAATSPHLENVSGDNALTGTISLMEGGNQYVIQSDAGSLTIAGNIENDAGAAFSGDRYLTLQGAGNGEVSGVIGGGSNTNGVIHVIKTGAGKWILSSFNTYAGTTTINNGTLALSSTGDISSSSSINVTSPGIFDATGLGGAFTVGSVSSQILGGTGLVKANGVINGANGTIAPGRRRHGRHFDHRHCGQSIQSHPGKCCDQHDSVRSVQQCQRNKRFVGGQRQSAQPGRQHFRLQHAQ